MALLAGPKKLNMLLRAVKRCRLVLLLLLCMWTLHLPANDSRVNMTTELYPKINDGTSNVSVATLIKGSEFHDDSKEAIKTLNSLKSFTMLAGVAQVIVLVEDSPSCASIPKELSLNIKCVALEHRCRHATLFKPTMGCIFDQLRTVATTEVLVFVNSDIVLFDGLMAAVHALKSTLKRYVIVGRRLDVQHDVQVDVQNRLAHLALERNALHMGILHGDHGLDYFVMKTEHLPIDFPEFLIGTWRWDNTLLALLMSRGFDILDGTSVITALHQGLNSAKKAEHRRRVGAEYNDELAYRYMRRAYSVGRVDAADYELKMLHHRLMIVPKPHHRLHSLHKCILRQVSLVEPLLLLSTATLDLKRTRQLRDEMLQMKQKNYLFLAGSVADEEIISKLNAKVCYAPSEKISTHSDPAAALVEANNNLLKVAQLGLDLVFSLAIPHEPDELTEVLSPIHFGQISMNLYETNIVIKISGEEIGLEYLHKVAHCQKQKLSRIWRCLHCAFSASHRIDWLERRYIHCFHNVWIVSPADRG